MLTCMELRRSIPIAGLVALLMLDIALIAWAVWPAPAVSGGATQTQPVASRASDPPDVGKGDAETPSPTIPNGESGPLRRLVAATSSTTAWLADAGSCEQPGQVHVTDSGGVDWTTEEAPGSVTRVRPSDASSAFIVGGDSDCESRVWYTGDRGDTWSPPQSAADAWGRVAGQPQFALRPGGDPVQPCPADVLDLVGFTAGRAAVLCADGSVRVTDDRGATWSTVIEREDTLAISFREPSEGAIVGIEDGCSGVAVFPVVGNDLGESACVEDAQQAPKLVAISVADGAVWLVAGDDVFRATRLGGPYDKVATWPTG
jgi:hypothetical protein